MLGLPILLLRNSLPLIFLSFCTWAQEGDFFQKADELYDQGDCEEAITEYRKLAHPQNSAERKEKILFRTSYCQFTLGQFQKSEKGFELYLKKYPNQQEARLKLAQSQFFNGKAALAKTNAQLITDAEFKTDALILEARAEMHENQLQKARDVLGQAKPEQSQAGEVRYWQGVVEYQSDQEEKAIEYFLEAQKHQKPDWLSQEAKAWLEQIEKNKKKFSSTISFGGVYDTNIGQGGGYFTAHGGGGGSKPAATGGYTADSGPYFQADFRSTWSAKRKSSTTSSLSLSSPFYGSNPAYNYQSIGLDLNHQFQTQSLKNYGFLFKYLETFYNGLYSQDYLLFTPSLGWNLTKKFWMKLSLPLNYYLNNKQILVSSFTSDMQYELNSRFQFLFGLGYTLSSAPAAVISLGPPPATTSGTVFSRYNTVMGSLGFVWNWSESFQLGASGSYSTTNYESENLPAVGNPPKARSDVTAVGQISMTKMLTKDFWYLTLSSSYTDNLSTGFAGLPTNGSVQNNTYYRSYSTLTTSFVF